MTRIGGEAHPTPEAVGAESPYDQPRALGERRSHAAPYDSLTFTLVTRARRELAVTLSAQPVFDLNRSVPVSRRIRRTVRHRGGEGALAALGRRSLEPMDLKRIDLQTLSHGLDLLHLGPDDSGVMPAFWRTVTASAGRFALLCSDLHRGASPGALLVEIMGGLEQASVEAVDAALGQFETAGLGVILHIAPDAAAARRFATVGVQCLSIDFAGVAHESQREWLDAADLIGAARDACSQVMLLNLRPDRGLAAERAGATHAVFAGMEAITV